MIMVHTTKGLMPIDQLNVRDEVEVLDNARKITTEWTHHGEVVRRDAAISMLRPIEAVAEQAKVA